MNPLLVVTLRKITVVTVGLGLAGSSFIVRAATGPSDATAKAPTALQQAPKAAASRYSRKAAPRMPLVFVPAAGEPAKAGRFVAHGGEYGLSLEKHAVTFETRVPNEKTAPAAGAAGRDADRAAAVSGRTTAILNDSAGWRKQYVHLDFVGANDGSEIEGTDAIAAKFNYFEGNDPSRWRHNVPVFSRVRYSSLYPGVDMVFYGKKDGGLEYDLVVAAGADPEQIRFKVTAAEKPVLDADGNLHLDGEAGNISLNRPMLYQDIDNGKKAIAGSFVQVAENEFAFKVSGYDRARPLIIDPDITLVYSTYMGGRHEDRANDIVIDAEGNSYVVGLSDSEDFPISGNAIQTTRDDLGTYYFDGTISKFDSSGILLYSTFLGGANYTGSAAVQNQAQTVAVDSEGNAYVAGSTYSAAFPVTSNAYTTTAGLGFLSELSPDGSTLKYSTYYPAAIAGVLFNAQGNLVMAGTAGPGLPTTKGSYMPTLTTGNAAFVAILDLAKSGATQLVAATYYGTDAPIANEYGPGDALIGFTLDAKGNIWFGGQAYTPNLPTTANAYQKSLPSMSSTCQGYGAALDGAAFFAELSSNLSKLEYATYFSGQTTGTNIDDCSEFVNYMSFDSAGNLYVSGGTASATFPVTTGVFQPTNPGPGDGSRNGFVAWVAKFAPGKAAPTWSSYLGGNTGNTFFSGAQHGSAVDSVGNLWLVGETQGGNNFPITAKSYQTALGAASYSGFVTEINPDGKEVTYSTYLGGTNGGDASDVVALAIDANNNLYLAGSTSSLNFPVTPDAFQSEYGEGCPSSCDTGSNDQFFAILGSGAIGVVSPVDGGNTGDTTITMSGAGFETGATCELVDGSTIIKSTAATVNATGTSISCTFDLDGATIGAYNVVVKNTDGTTLTKKDGFTVESGGQPKIWVNIVGRPVLRNGYPTNFDVEFGNSGNVDAYFTLIWVKFDKNYKVEIASPIELPANWQGTDITPLAVGSDPEDGFEYLPLLIQHLAPGDAQNFVLQVTPQNLSAGSAIWAYARAPWFDNLADAKAALTTLRNSPSALATTCQQNAQKSYLSDCFGPIANQALSEADQAAGDTTGKDLTKLGGYIADLWTDALNGTVPDPPAGASARPAQNADSFAASANVRPRPHGGPLGDVRGWVIGQILSTAATWAATEIQNNVYQNVTWSAFYGACEGGTRKVIFIFYYNGSAGGNYTFNAPCDPSKPDPIPNGCTQVGNGTGVTSSTCPPIKGAVDPNYKSGPSGDRSKSQYVAGGANLTYNVGFENESNASLPAAAVVVTDQLDPTKVDLSSVTLGGISFGSNLITLPIGTSSYSTTYAPTGVTSYVVRVQGSLNSDSGLLKWTLQTIDPSTGLPPTDPTVGFLPPDKNGIEGQGSVLFNVNPKSGLTTGTKITNTATVVFDANAPIKTPTWLNTLDVTPPVSKVTALPATEAATLGVAAFKVSWSGTDVGSGVASYSIYVSDNGGAFKAWQTATTATSASYTGDAGHTYGFYSIATDNVGNVEAAKTKADTSTDVNGPSATTTLTVSPNEVLFGTSVTITASVTASSKSYPTPTGTVTFYDGSKAIKDKVALSSGKASFATTTLASGKNAIRAVYSGNATYPDQTSNTVEETIARLAPTVKLASSANPIADGKSVVFTATVAGTGPAPTGTITFYTNGRLQLDKVTVSGGKATLTTSSLPAGTDSVTAVYSGDITYAEETSNAVKEVVDRATPTVALTASPNPAATGSDVTFTVKASGDFGTPTGTVVFYISTVEVGSAALTGGVATYSTKTLTAGSHSVYAIYSGDSNYLKETSNTVKETIK